MRRIISGSVVMAFLLSLASVNFALGCDERECPHGKGGEKCAECGCEGGKCKHKKGKKGKKAAAKEDAAEESVPAATETHSEAH